MSTLIYQQFLHNAQISFEETRDGIFFQYQGGYFIIGDSNQDELYLQLMMPHIYTINPGTERLKAFVALNTLHQTIKAVKGTLMEDNSIWLATEMFIDKTPDLEDFFFRLLQILHSARLEFNILISK